MSTFGHDIQGESVAQGTCQHTDRGSFVSVVMATNRAGPFLEQALESVSRQTLDSWEMVVVDDGCQDRDSLESAVAAHPNVRLVSAPGGNVSIARNIGVACTSGEILAFIDDDDIWQAQRLERMVEQFLANPHAVAGYSGMGSIDSAGVRIGDADQFRANLHQIVRREVSIMLPNFMIRRSCFAKVGGFHSSLHFAEDLDLILRASFCGQFVFVDESLVSYRTHASNVTRNHRPLATAIREVLQLNLSRLDPVTDHELAGDFKASLQKNRRFAGWSAWRQARRDIRLRRFGHFISEFLWIARFSPDLPWLVVQNRRRRRGSSPNISGMKGNAG